MTKIFRENNESKKFNKIKEGSYSSEYDEYYPDSDEESHVSEEELKDDMFEADWEEFDIDELYLDNIKIFELEKNKKSIDSKDLRKEKLPITITGMPSYKSNYDTTTAYGETVYYDYDDNEYYVTYPEEWVGEVILGNYEPETKTLKFRYNYKKFPYASTILDNDTFVTFGKLDDTDCKNVKEMIIKHLKQFVDIDYIE